MCVVAGVSGSGKSTLVRQVFYPALRQALGLVADDARRASTRIRGAEARARARSPSISRRSGARRARCRRRSSASGTRSASSSRRSPEAKVRGFGPARFSFNTPQRRALPGVRRPGRDRRTRCRSCPTSSRRARRAAARASSRRRSTCATSGLSIGDVLHLSAEEAAQRLRGAPEDRAAARDARAISASATCSSARARTRSRAARRSASSSPPSSPRARAHEPTVYVLDEPTTGLHLADVARLVDGARSPRRARRHARHHRAPPRRDRRAPTGSSSSAPRAARAAAASCSRVDRLACPPQRRLRAASSPQPDKLAR